MRRRRYSELSDVFSYAVMLYEITARSPPWMNETNLDVVVRVCGGDRMTPPTLSLVHKHTHQSIRASQLAAEASGEGNGNDEDGVVPTETARPLGVMPPLDDRWDALMMGCWAQQPDDRLSMEQVDEDINGLLDDPTLWEWPGYERPSKSERDRDTAGAMGVTSGLADGGPGTRPYDDFEDLEEGD